MEYRDYKYAIMGEFKVFDEYAKEQQEKTKERIYNKFSEMYDNIKRILSKLSVEEMDELLNKVRKDEDIPECIGEVIAGIGIAKVLERHKGEDNSRAVLALLLLQLFGGHKDE